jgi:hypothetical protein
MVVVPCHSTPALSRQDHVSLWCRGSLSCGVTVSVRRRILRSELRSTNDDSATRHIMNAAAYTLRCTCKAGYRLLPFLR